MYDLTIWLTYHDDKQIQEYGLRESDTIRLFKGNEQKIVRHQDEWGGREEYWGRVEVAKESRKLVTNVA